MPCYGRRLTTFLGNNTCQVYFVILFLPQPSPLITAFFLFQDIDVMQTCATFNCLSVEGTGVDGRQRRYAHRLFLATTGDILATDVSEPFSTVLAATFPAVSCCDTLNSGSCSSVHFASLHRHKRQATVLLAYGCIATSRDSKRGICCFLPGAFDGYRRSPEQAHFVAQPKHAGLCFARWPFSS